MVVRESLNELKSARSEADAEILNRRRNTVGEKDPWSQIQYLCGYEEKRDGGYRFYFVYQTRRIPGTESEHVECEALRAPVGYAFIPGMAQISRGNKGWGAFFIASEATLIGGIVACETLRASYKSKINSTKNPAEIRKYRNTMSNLALARNICIGGAAAVYVWNVIDGLVVKGCPQIRLADASLRITPYTSPDFTSGVYLSLNF